MRKLLWSAAAGSLLAALAMGVAADPPKADPPKTDTPADSPLAVAKAKFDATVKEKQAAIAKAENLGEKGELTADLREYRAIEGDNLFDLAEQEATTRAAFEVFAELQGVAFDKEKAKKARTLIETHHLDKPYIKPLLLTAMQGKGESDAILLKAIADKNPDKECQGIATFALGSIAKRKMKGAGDEEKAEAAKQARAAFAKVGEKYADVKLNGESLGELARGQLAALDLLERLAVGKPVPDIVGDDLDGKAFKLSEGKGKVTVLSFWATWCPPCMALVPHERELLEKMKDRPFVMYGVNGDPELTDKVRQTIADKQITWRSFKNQQGKQPPLSQLWDIDGWPTIYVVDAKGVIRHRWTGSPGAEVMDKEIEKLVAEAEGKPPKKEKDDEKK